MLANTIQSIMSTEIVSLALGVPLKEAIITMSEKKISCIVIDQNKKPMGIITERDILRIAALDKDINKMKVEDVMASPVNTISRELDIYEAAVYLEKNKFRRIIITNDEGELLGLVTQTDLKNHLGAVYYVKLKSIETIMTDEVVTAEYEENLLKLTRRMNGHNIGCLVVCRNNKPMGIITERDITRLMAGEKHCGELLAKDVVKWPLITISKTSSVYDATRIMTERDIRRLVVVDEKENLLGLVTESDIVKHLESDYLESLRSIVEKDRIYINTIKEGILECSPSIDGIFTWINQAGAKILGYKSSHEIIGKSLKDIFVNAEDLDQLFDLLEAGDMAKDFSAVLKKSNNKHFFAEGTFYFVRDEHGKVVCIEGIIRDVTERKIMEEKIKRHSLDLEKKVKEKTEEIRKQNKELREINAKLHELTVMDGLTGIRNFRYFSQVLEMEFKRAKRYDMPLACIILDIDDFKFINDRFGHTSGDFALIKTAYLLKNTIRDTDIVARYGGDEFTIVLPNTDLKDACVVGQKILERFRGYKLKKDSLILGKISLSLGISALPDEKIETHRQMLEYADKAMYRAKEHGKNGVCIWAELDKS